MRNFIITLLILAPFVSVDAVCQKCERIREENAQKSKDQNWEFYEDWVEIQKGEETGESASVDSDDSEED